MRTSAERLFFQTSGAEIIIHYSLRGIIMQAIQHYGIIISWFQDKQLVPVFALGQHLNQFYVPQEGDVLKGRLKRHSNGQWLLTDIDIQIAE